MREKTERNQKIYDYYLKSGLSQNAIARVFKCNPSSVNRAIHRIERRLKEQK